VSRRLAPIRAALGACNSGPAEEITLSQNAATTINGGHWCGPTGSDTSPTVENSFYRVFELTEFGVLESFRLSTLTVGVFEANNGAQGAETVHGEVIIHAYTGPIGGTTLDMTAMRVLGTVGLAFSESPKGVDRRAVFKLADATHPVIDIDPSIRVIAVELHSPNVPTNDRTFRIGTNALGATGPSYHRCPGAQGGDLEVPTSLAARGYPTANIVLELTGFVIPIPDRDAHPPL
jgi:hypothetical protein